MSALELKIPPLALVLVFGAAMWFGAKLAPSLSFSFPGQFLIVTALSIAGAGIAAAGVAAFRRAQTTVDPREPAKSASLVSTGVYRMSRNPMYVGLLLALAAWASYVSNALAFIGLPAFILYMNRYQITPEEEALRKKFGSAFVEYEQSVRRWL